MPLLPAAPLDQSGGIMVVQATLPTESHHMRVHVLPFSLTQFVVGGVASQPDDGHHNYQYTGSRPAGSELGINDTFAAWAAVLKAFYATNATLTLAALYQVVSNVPQEVVVLPTPSPVSGTSATGNPAAQYRAFMQNMQFRTMQGGKARVSIMGSDGNDAMNAPAFVTSSSGGTTRDQALVGYITGANTAIVGHDGQKLSAPAHVTYCINRRLRRRFGYA